MTETRKLSNSEVHVRAPHLFTDAIVEIVWSSRGGAKLHLNDGSVVIVSRRIADQLNIGDRWVGSV